VRRLGLTVTRQQQERAREPLLAGVEKLIDKITASFPERDNTDSRTAPCSTYKTLVAGSP
jgi:hypothetical protein